MGKGLGNVDPLLLIKLINHGLTAAGRMFAGREATAAEIQELGAALLPDMGEAEIVAEHRFEISQDSEADVHQVVIAVPEDAMPADEFEIGELSGRLSGIAERWARGCIAERRVEVSELL